MNNDLKFIPPPTPEELQLQQENYRKKIKSEQLMIILAFALALFLRISRGIVYNGHYDEWLPLHGIFWLLFSGAYLALNHDTLFKNKKACIVFAVGALIALSQLPLFASSNVFWDNVDIYGLNTFILPIIFTIGVQLNSFHPTNPEEHQNLILSCIIGFFTMPFTAVNKIVLPFKGAFAKKKDGRGIAFRVIIGLICSIPLVLLAIYFLMAADARFSFLMHRILNFLVESLDIPNIILTTLFLLLFTLFAYSYLWNTRFNNQTYTINPIKKQINAITIATMLFALLAVYILFCLVQLSYLFPSSGLPNDLSYAIYARRGFLELIIVCLINLSIYFAVLRFVPDQKIIRISLTILLVITLFMAISSCTRLLMYIIAYDAFTFLRTLSLWFILYVIFTIIVCTLNLFRNIKNIQVFLLLSLIIWYGILVFAYVPFMSLLGV